MESVSSDHVEAKDHSQSRGANYDFSNKVQDEKKLNMASNNQADMIIAKPVNEAEL